MKKIIKYLAPYTLPIIAIVAFVFVQVMTDLQLPDYMARIVNDGIVAADTGVIYQVGIKMLLVAFLGAACSVMAGFLAARVGAGFSMNLRDMVFKKVESFSLAEFDQFSTASLITRTTNDIQQIQMVVIMFFRIVVMAPIMGVGALLKAINKDVSMTWIMGLAIAVLLTLIIVLFSVAVPKFKRLQKMVDRLNLVMREHLTGLRVIRAFNSQKYQEDKFDAANRDLTKINLFVNRLMVLMQPIMMLILNGMSLAVIWVGAHMINQGSLMIGDMIAFMQYSIQVIIAFLMISIVFIMLPRASVSGQRVAEVLAVKPAIRDPEKPITAFEQNNGRVEFNDVCFSYPGADSPALEHIDFSAEPGQTTAFIGSTGCGKTTLIHLILRFYDVSSGKILVDGVDVREMKQEDLFQKIGYVPQKSVLFSGTVEGNIKYGVPEADLAQVEEASKIAQAYEFVDQLEERFDNPIAQGGTNVSGGQKQRLSIARAIIKNPEIYMLDDSFSALDFKTDAALRRALKERTKNATVLIVAQRISTIMNADKIVVLDEGKIVGVGTHRDLLKSCEVYKEIALSQLSEEELA